MVIFCVLGIFWSFLGFWDILVIFRFLGYFSLFFFEFRGYFGYFVGFVVILVILRFWGILVIFKNFRVLWSFTLYDHFGNWVG